MNVFVIDKDPAVAAQMLCDCHVRKMCVETAQILSGVMLRRGMTLLDGMPKPQNVNHPVIVAAASSEEATNWTCFYFYSILREFHIRFKKPHKYFTISPLYLDALVGIDSSDDHSNLAICCGDLDVSGLDIVSAYRKYYLEVKKPQLSAKKMWKFTNRKDWTE